MYRLRKFWVGVVLLLSPFVVCGGILFGPIAYQQYRMWRFSRPFFNYPLPPQTDEIARNTSWGVLTGNGHYCDFMASRALVTNLSEDEIIAYYEEVGLPPLREDSQFATLWGTNGGVSVFVKFHEPIARWALTGRDQHL
ncbi:MAG: hypothetical protein CUN54_02810 [Phototrophicales bacterium]|nr:MAG: hypothetical protein CUN54_02810 [Phototrophicales bacterium]